MDIQRLEEFPAYVSCIRNFGRPILPPLLSPAEREEMVKIRHEAIIAETRIARRAIQPSLMMRVQEVIKNIEKSEINMLKNDSVSMSNDNSSDLVDISASGDVIFLPMKSSMSSVSFINHHQQSDHNTTKTDYDEVSSASITSDTEDVLFASESVDYFHEDNVSGGEFIENDDSCLCKSSGSNVLPVLAPSLHKEKLSISSQESMTNGIDTGYVSEQVLISNAVEVPLEPKIADGDEVESESLTTVILRPNGDNHNDTDSDSVVTSLAHSTDLENYFDSPGENGHFAESLALTECERNTMCMVSSVSSDVESSATLVSTDVKTPIPSCESVRAESCCDMRPRSSSDQSFMSFGDGNASKSKTEPSACRQHIRRSSYTLERPSPALIKAYTGYYPAVNFDNTGVSPPSRSGPTDDILVSKANTSQALLPDTPSEDLSEVILEAGDSVHIRPTTLRSEIVENINNWASKVVHTFPETPELTATDAQFPLLNNSCDIIRDSSRILLGYEPFSDNTTTPDTPNEVPQNFLQYYATTSESDLELNGANNPKDLYSPPQCMPFEKSHQSAETAFSNGIFQNLQEFQKQKMEQLLNDQREQWDKLQMEFKNQELILCQRLQSFSCSQQSDEKDKCGRRTEVEISNLNESVKEKSVPKEEHAELLNCQSIILKSPIVSDCPHLIQNQIRRKLLCNEDMDPFMKAKFDRVSAAVKGYLTRRLFNTERVQSLIQTIKDTLICALKFHEETPVKKGEFTEQDADLNQRFLGQLNAACFELHDIFFELSTKERMLIISKSREISKERKSKELYVSLPSSKDGMQKQFSKNKYKPMLSSATVKVLERKKARSTTGDRNAGFIDRKFGDRSVMRGVRERLRNSSNHNPHITSPSSMLRNAKPTTPVKRNILGRSPPKLLKSARRLVYHKAEANSTARVFKLDGLNHK